MVSDKNDYRLTTNALKALRFSNEVISTVWQVVAAVLHLGNITFKSMRWSFWNTQKLDQFVNDFNISVSFAVDEDNLVVSNKNALKNASKLLNVTEDEMTNSLTQRVIAAHGDIVRKSHSTQQAEYGRDALAKAIYDRLFTWIIQRINQTIVVPGSDASKRFNKVIGVLDIYGFEIFDTNSFEQFCINYCNEKLQQLFIGRFFQCDASESRLYSID